MADELTPLLPAYALEALPEDERLAVTRHLPGCPDCQRALREMQMVTLILPLAVDEVEPPVGLRDRLLAAARGPAAVAPPMVTLPAGPRPGRRERRGWVPLLAAAAVVVAVGLAGWNVVLQREVSQLRQQVAQQHVTVWTARGNEKAPAAVAELSYLPDQHATLVRVTGLPRLPDGRIYELWIIQNGQPLPRGTPPLGPNGELRAVLGDDPKTFEQFVITDEPSPGGPKPQGPAVLVAPLRM